MKLNRREFLLASGCAAAGLAGAASARTRIGLVQSSHGKLARPASIEDPLDYEKVRAMVWKAIEYGAPRAGSLEAKIRPGSWVVVKPNACFLPPQPDYTTGDATDFRVTRAVIEYVARKSKAARITVAEGGSYRGLRDPATLMEVKQNGARVDLTSYDWGDKEFPGWGGSLGGMLREFASQFPGRKFDYADLSYDAMRDASGAFRYIEVPKTRDGVGAFAARSSYCITNTVANCDFVIDVPVMKIHSDCGITACLKNYVGTAPREVYAPSYRFSNRLLHDNYSVEGRVDGFVADLVSFHPPDYSVVDAIRGLQYANHNNRRPDQMMRNNLVFAGEDPVAMDTLVARLVGFNAWDIDYLHMTSRRGIGTMDLRQVEIVGDDVDRIARRWAKPNNWHGRGNREWLVSADVDAPLAAWKRHETRGDTLDFAQAAGASAPGHKYGAAVRVQADGARKALLWAGARGHVVAALNGEKVMEEENLAAPRFGLFKAPVELRSGENLLVFRVQSPAEPPQLNAMLAGPDNDAGTVEGIRWSA
jgi:uncharacterized protein (DUF362 family)